MARRREPLLSFASALSAPFTGALGDRLGQGRVLAVAAISSWPYLSWARRRFEEATDG